MKKLLFSAVAFATLLFASCQQGNLETAQGNAVTFTVEAPAVVQTKSIADGLNVNELVYEVWMTKEYGVLTADAQKLYRSTTGMSVVDGQNKATITLDLVNDQKFTVLFWAQVGGTGAYNTDELTEVTYAKNSYLANDESLAAFYGVAYVNDSKHVTKTGEAASSTVVLRRPFAQVNIGTLNTSTEYDVVLYRSKVTLSDVPTVFNVATSAVDEETSMTFEFNAVPSDPATLKVNNNPYEWAAMNYVFAGSNLKVEYDIETKVQSLGNETIVNVTHEIDQVPVKENFRTNIIGNLLTSDVKYEIVVDADFNEPDLVGNVKQVSSSDELRAAIASAANGDFIALEDGTYEGLFHIKSKGLSIYPMNEGKVTVNGKFGIEAQGCDVNLSGIKFTNEYAGSVVVPNSNIPAAAHCVSVYTGSVNISNCTFDIKKDGGVYFYAINPGDFCTVEDCTFNCNGHRPILSQDYVAVKNNVFNDQYRYAIQVYGNVCDGSGKIIFSGNRIVNPCQTSGEPFAAGVSVSGSKSFYNSSIEVADNTLVSSEFNNLVYTYEPGKNGCVVDMSKVTVVGAGFITEEQAENYEDVAPGVLKNGVEYLVSSAAGLKTMNEMFANKTAGRDAVLNLTGDIDFTGYTWTPVDSHADSAFEIAEINGNGHTISNLTINGQAMFTRFAGLRDVVIKDITFDNANVNSNGNINTSILTVQTYQNVLLDNVDVKNSTIIGGYKVAPLIATVYNENPSSTITATLKNCDVENVTVKATSYDFCTTGMVAFVHASDNDEVEFENCTVSDVKLYAPNVYTAHAAIYTTGSETLFNEAEGVTVNNVTFENI